MPERLPFAPHKHVVFEGDCTTGPQDAGVAHRDVGKRPRVKDGRRGAFDVENPSLYHRGQNWDMVLSFWDLDDPFLPPRRAKLMAGTYDLRRLDELGVQYAMREIMNSGCWVSFYPLKKFS